MGFLLKFIFFLLIVAIGGGFIINQTPSLKQKAIEVINPAVKEARILGELKTNLAALEANIDEVSSSLSVKTSSKIQAETKNKVGESKSLIVKSKELLEEAVKTNQEGSGLVRQTVGRLIETLVDKTPFPADHLKTTDGSLVIPVANGTPVVCPAK